MSERFQPGERVALLENGREVRATAAGRFEVQPRNDNYWITVDTLDDAYQAFEHPEQYT